MRLEKLSKLFHLSNRLLDEGYEVIGLDNLNSYYEVSLKEFRLNILCKREKFNFIKASLESKEFSCLQIQLKILNKILIFQGLVSTSSCLLLTMPLKNKFC